LVKIIFDDSEIKQSLWPLTATRNAADIRVGILTIREKWERVLKNFDSDMSASITINAAIIPSQKSQYSINDYGTLEMLNDIGNNKQITFPWDIFKINDWAIRKDFELMTLGRKSQKISNTNTCFNTENIFLEEGAKVECSVMNASDGPVYIGKDATVMEGCLIRGPFALCEGATLKMGTKIYGATTVGPYCVAGGEIKNAVLFGYSNKAHDGYLGDSVIGEWCNLGAGTTNSNVKNSAAEVKVWNNASKEFVVVGLKAGLIMGDYSRSAINTTFNTGSVVGVSCNIFGHGFPPKLVSNFTWGKEKYTFGKVLQDIDNWKKLKGKSITQNEIEILTNLHQQSIT
jgi:UDP-N-acetylglucosamine diphosphorylase/glucosamine-1-phosphate N-acetyltransferase